MNNFHEVYVSLSLAGVKYLLSAEYSKYDAIFGMSFNGEEKEYSVGFDGWMTRENGKKLIADHVADPSKPFGYLPKGAKPTISDHGYYLYTVGLVDGGTVTMFSKVEIAA